MRVLVFTNLFPTSFRQQKMETGLVVDDVRAAPGKAHRNRSPDVLILGPYPPPFGGVSSHVQRVLPLLAHAGVDARVLNHFGGPRDSVVVGTMRRNPVLYFLLPRRFRPSVIHYHHSRLSTLVAVALGRRRRGTPRYVITIHAPGSLAALRSRFGALRIVTRWALRRFDEAIAVNERIAADLRAALPGLPVSTIPAFLPASNEAYGDLPSEVAQFVAQPGRTIVVAAYRISFTRAGADLYGLDTAIEAFLELAPGDATLRLAVFLAQPPRTHKERRYLDALRLRVAEARLAERVLVVAAAPLMAAFRYDVVFARPTRSDGDALSIREALSCGVPVIASDVVVRPPDTHLVRVGDVGALRDAIAHVVGTPGRSAAVQNRYYFEELLRIYRRNLVLGRRA